MGDWVPEPQAQEGEGGPEVRSAMLGKDDQSYKKETEKMCRVLVLYKKIQNKL